MTVHVTFPTMSADIALADIPSAKTTVQKALEKYVQKRSPNRHAVLKDDSEFTHTHTTDDGVIDATYKITPGLRTYEQSLSFPVTFEKGFGGLPDETPGMGKDVPP